MRAWVIAGLLLSMVLSGCSDGGKEPPVVTGDPDTGSIHGLVVDQAIIPVAGATVTLSTGQNMTTSDAGLFEFAGLAPGDYVISVTKLGFKGAVSAGHVEAGDNDPSLTRVQLERLSSATPYLDHFKLEGFYSCTFALVFITDSCEFAYRTAWDGANGTGNEPPAPRSVQNFRNTQYIDIPQDTFTIVQEGFWTDEAVPTFWIMIDETPIVNDCDCSTSYGNRIGGQPLLNRLERFDAAGNPNTNFTADETAHDSPKGIFPLGMTVASRGFIPFQDSATDVAYGVNFQFTIITTLFHNYAPDPAWTFETRDNYPIG
jgi:hypothetical protein